MVLEAAGKIRSILIGGGFRVKVDERDGISPGFKFNDWEMRGVPLRIEIGPKDVAKGSFVFARRDQRGKESKYPVLLENIAGATEKVLADIQDSLYRKALAFRDSNTARPKDYVEFRDAVEKGFADSHWCGSSECEQKIKEETKATTRCIPLGRGQDPGLCIYCGKPAPERVIFGKAY